MVSALELTNATRELYWLHATWADRPDIAQSIAGAASLVYQTAFCVHRDQSLYRVQPCRPAMMRPTAEWMVVLG